MKKFLFTLKAFWIAAFCLAVLLALYAILHGPVFERGESYEFYMGTSSEKIVHADSPLEKLFLTGVKGESVRYKGDRAQELITRYRAKVLFTEEAAGITNYYCYSPVLKNAIVLNGQLVNLHIAVCGERTAAGNPVIFGGF